MRARISHFAKDTARDVWTPPFTLSECFSAAPPQKWPDPQRCASSAAMLFSRSALRAVSRAEGEPDSRCE